jgi:cullin-5
MEYADTKLREEEDRARRYLDTTHKTDSVQKLTARCVHVLVSAFQEQILAECPVLIKQNHIDSKLLF